MANTAASVLITRCLDNLSKASAGTSRSGDTMSNLAMNWLNNALIATARKHDFTELDKTYSMSTIDGTKTYNLPSSTKIVHSLRIIDGSSSRRLILVPPEHFDLVIPYPENSTEGRPTWYMPYAGNFDLYPIPDAVYSLYSRVTLWPALIASTATAIDYEPNKDDVIVSYMTAEGFRHYQMYEDSNLWLGDYAMKLKDAISVDEAEPDFNPVGRGFNSDRAYVGIGDPWNDPMVYRN